MCFGEEYDDCFLPKITLYAFKIMPRIEWAYPKVSLKIRRVYLKLSHKIGGGISEIKRKRAWIVALLQKIGYAELKLLKKERCTPFKRGKKRVERV